MRLFHRFFKTCATCHFLNKTYPPRGSTGQYHDFSWSQEERESGQSKHAEHAAASCAKGIWDEGVGPVDIAKELKKWRRNRCFYIKHSPGMLYKGADSLLERRLSLRRSRREQFHLVLAIVTCAVVIATLVLALTSKGN